MIKNFFALLGSVIFIAIIAFVLLFGNKLIKFNSQALATHSTMFQTLFTTGNLTDSLVKRYRVNDDITYKKLLDSIEGIASGYHLKIIQNTPVYSNKKALQNEVRHTTTIYFSNENVEERLLNHSTAYAMFLPVKISIVELGDGDKYLYTHNFELMHKGGYTLSPSVMNVAQALEKSLHDIASKTSKGVL